MAFTVAQVSDMHLGPGTVSFRSNFNVLATAIRAADPDFTVLTGDLSRDGAGDEADLEQAIRYDDSRKIK